MWIVLDLGVKCTCMSDALVENNYRNGMWFACEDGVSPT